MNDEPWSQWAKSKRSFANGNCVEWRKSTRSASGNCVEVAPRAQVRDSKDPDGPRLSFTGGAWARFVRRIKQEP